jgi:hypothetical protein
MYYNFYNPKFNDPFLNKIKIRAIRPPLNIIYYKDNKSLVAGPLARLIRQGNPRTLIRIRTKSIKGYL